MKMLVKVLKTAVLAAVIVFCAAACALLADDDEVTYGPTHYTGALKIEKEQVWLQNKEAKRQNDDWYFKFNDDCDINIVTGFSYDDQGKVINKKSVCSGKIEKGSLSFEVAELSQAYLVSADVLTSFFKEYKDVTFEPSDVKGTNILPITSAGESLNREGLFLLDTSVGLESVLYLYVDNDCRVRGNPGVITWNLETKSYFSNTESAIDISLQKGWNTIYRSEVFDRTSGYDNVSMGLSNPDNFKWVLYR